MARSMILKTAAVASALLIAGEALAATIYGTIKQNNQPVKNNTPLVLSCGGSQAASTTTDERGNYRLTANRTGRCDLKVGEANNMSVGEVILFQDPTRYDFEVPSAGDKTRLIRR